MLGRADLEGDKVGCVLCGSASITLLDVRLHGIVVGKEDVATGVHWHPEGIHAHWRRRTAVWPDVRHTTVALTVSHLGSPLPSPQISSALCL